MNVEEEIKTLKRESIETAVKLRAMYEALEKMEQAIINIEDRLTKLESE